MRFIVVSVALSVVAVASDQAQKLFDLMDSLQAPLADFRCEFEGTVRIASQTPPGSDVAKEDRNDSFSGVFLWRKGGGFWCDSFHENARPRQNIERRTVVVRNQENHAEQHRRFNDAVDGQRTFGSPSILRARPTLEGPQSLFLLEDLRDEATNEAHTVSVRDDQIDGRALKALEVRVKDIDQLLRRYWIDMGRNGHVVRLEAYWTGERLWLRRDIKLAQFRVAGAQIWMPISAEQVTYSPPSASETGESQPESIVTISILNGTTTFNGGLEAKNFATGYSAVKPNSVSGRRRSDQFDRQTQAAESIHAVLRKAPEDVLAQEVQEVPVPTADIRPESQFELRYFAYGLAVVAVIVVINVRTRRRLRGRVL